jgi:Tol biopolymer transport system component
MMARRIAAILFVPLMIAFGSGVYLYLGTLKSKVVKERAQIPTVIKPKFVLPGTMFVVQTGRLYKLNGGNFTEVGPSGDWSQPALTPDHQRLIVVSRSNQFSDLVMLDLSGHVIKRITKDDARIIDANHWAFYPRVSSDGSTLIYAFDSPKRNGVDLSIWSMPLNGSQSAARRWTDPYFYTGGDVSPIPLGSGGVLFVRHSIDQSTAVHSQIYYQSHPLGLGKALTDLTDDCIEPALSPDGTQLAMICSHGRQTTSLEVASFNGTTLGARRVLADNGLFASPAWSPDGKALAYYAPFGPAGHFQLWYLAVSPTASPNAAATPSTTAGGSSPPIVFPTAQPTPIQVTEGVDLTATSPPAWY